MREPEHKLPVGAKVYWKAKKGRKIGIVESQSVGWNPPLAYVRFSKYALPIWIGEESLVLVDFNPSVRYR